jgi:hypothetical protein
MNEKNLPAFVKLVNDVAEATNTLAADVMPKASAFYGQKIVKADGDLTAAFAKAVPIHSDSVRGSRLISYWINATSASLWLNVKGCAPLETSCIYHEETVYLGNIRGGILGESEATKGRQPARTDWTVAEVLSARKRYAEAAEAVSEARRACGPFGER